MNPPGEFLEQYWQMRERMQWAEFALERGNDVAQARSIVDEFHSFYDRWRPGLQEAAICAALDEVREHIDTALRPGLEALFLERLGQVLEAYNDWWMSEKSFQLSIAFISLMKHAPPQLRPELERIHRQYMEKEFDPETHYRDSERDAIEEEAKFRNALAGLEADWPDRMDAATRERLNKLDGADARAWQAEVQQKLATLMARLKAIRTGRVSGAW